MKIKVSVMMTTYNHGPFIAEAVKSALAQAVDFPFEIVIGEDCSTDNTRAILQDLQAANPGVIRLLARETNWGRRKNFIDTLWACQGEYIAILEGDDYWTSMDKLQRQADLLDQHPEYALCFHPAVKRFEEDGRDVIFKPPAGRDRFSLVDLLDRNFIATCAVMFRSRLFPDLPSWFDHVPAGDWPLHVLNAQHGDIGYLPDADGRTPHPRRRGLVPPAGGRADRCEDPNIKGPSGPPEPRISGAD